MMKYLKIISVTSFILIHTCLLSQTSVTGTDTKDKAILSWLENLVVPGVSIDNDSILISEESNRLLNEANYRQEMYPQVYTWEKTTKYISTQELSKAFWYMINLYRINDKNKKLVLRSLLAYNQILKVDKILVSSFYTYIYMDLETSKVVNGKLEITAPHIMEDKLNTLKDILYYIEKFKDSSPAVESER